MANATAKTSNRRVFIDFLPFFLPWVFGEGITGEGLERTSGSYRVLTKLFNMPADDYKRFLNFLRKHHCHLPFQQFRRGRGPGADLDAPLDVASGTQVGTIA